MSLLGLALLISCGSEFNDVDPILRGDAGPPKINSVSEAREDQAVTQGTLEGTYIIRGENLETIKSITFNGFPGFFQPALSTNTVAFVSISRETPFLGQNNIMRLETEGGIINYPFSILTIETFEELTYEGQKAVKLIGGDFTNTTDVSFNTGNEEDGNLVERPADILDITAGEVIVAVPAGVEQAFIFLTTSGGATAQSESYGFNYSIYIDGLNADWSTGEWGGTHDLLSTEQATGTTSIKSIREPWSGLTFYPPAGFAFDDYDSITVSIYGTGAPGDSVNLALNDFDATVNLVLVPGEWTKFVIPLSEFYPSGGAPDNITRMDFQESSNTGLPQYIFYVDDFGFL